MMVSSFKYENTQLVLASDMLFLPSSMESIASKLTTYINHCGYILIANPERERITGCRVTFVECIRKIGDEVEIYRMEDGGRSGDNNIQCCIKISVVSDNIDIDGSLMKTGLGVFIFLDVGVDKNSHLLSLLDVQ